ncbi:MAG: sugar ABC transporter permease [Thermotoga sp.]|nr:MAG: sugar ABC transporter permease [Thermotoga sp.]
MKKQRGALFLFLTPGFLVMFFIALVPFAFAIFMSLINLNVMYSSKPHFVGLENYINLFTDRRALNAFRNTGIFVGVAVGIEFIIALPMSYIFYSTFKRRRMRNLIMLLIAFPMMIPKVTSGLLWKFLYNPLFGLVNYFRSLIGMQPFAFLSNPTTALISIVLVDIWQWTPFMILILLSSLEALPEEPFEAATIDRANEFQKFWYLAVPMLRPIFFVAVIFRVIDALRTFDTIYVMTSGGPGIATETVDIFAYLIGISQGGRLSYASAASIILLIITIIISNVITKYLYKEDITA